MLDKVFEQIRVYASFTVEKEFAKSELRKIIEWAWLSLDMLIINRDEHNALYNCAIEAIVNLDN